MSIDTNAETLAEAYRRGRDDQLEACVQHNLTRIADVLNAVDKHASDPVAMRAAIYDALGAHGGAR